VHLPASKGEMIVELHERVRKALDHIVTTLDNDPEQPRTVLICTHAATMIAAGRVLTGQMPDDPDTDDFQCFTAGLSKFVRRSADPEKGVAANWDCELNSETSYLSGGAERGWYVAALCSYSLSECFHCSGNSGIVKTGPRLCPQDRARALHLKSSISLFSLLPMFPLRTLVLFDTSDIRHYQAFQWRRELCSISRQSSGGQGDTQAMRRSGLQRIGRVEGT
jgi:hypothetical protein